MKKPVWEVPAGRRKPSAEGARRVRFSRCAEPGYHGLRGTEGHTLQPYGPQLFWRLRASVLCCLCDSVDGLTAWCGAISSHVLVQREPQRSTGSPVAHSQKRPQK